MTSDATTKTPRPNKARAYANKGDLTNGPIHKHLIRLTIPMIWGIFAVILIQIADTYFVGLLGTTELAAISFTFPVAMIISHLVFGMNIAMSSNIARLIGQKDTETVKRVTLHGIFMAVVASAIIAILTYFALDPIFAALGAGPDTMPMIREYMPIWLIGSVVLAAPVNGNSAVRAAGDSFWPAIVMTTSALVNLILDPILIFGKFGFPAMGVKGAAVATLCGYSAAMILGLYVLMIRKKLLSFEHLYLDQIGDTFKRLIVIAAPAGITNIIGPLTLAILTAILASYSTEAVAAFGVVSRVESFAMLAVISLGLGMAPIVGQNWGAERYDRVHTTIKQAINFNFIWSFTIAAILALFAHEIAGFFTDDPKIIKIAALYFYIVPASLAFGNLIFGWSSAFNAMGMPARAFVMITVKSIVLTIPALYIGSWLGGITGIFIGVAAVNFAGGLFFHILSWRACLAHEHHT